MAITASRSMAFGNRMRVSATPAAKSTQSGGIIGKIRSILFDGMHDSTSNPPALHATSQNISGEIMRLEERESVEASCFRENARNAIAIPSKLQGAKRWMRCGK